MDRSLGALKPGRLFAGPEFFSAARIALGEFFKKSRATHSLPGVMGKN
jgi:hypothetical protein